MSGSVVRNESERSKSERDRNARVRALAAVPRNDVDAAIRYLKEHIIPDGDYGEVEALLMLQDDDRELTKRLNAYTLPKRLR